MPDDPAQAEHPKTPQQLLADIQTRTGRKHALIVVYTDHPKGPAGSAVDLEVMDAKAAIECCARAVVFKTMEIAHELGLQPPVCQENATHGFLVNGACKLCGAA